MLVNTIDKIKQDLIDYRLVTSSGCWEWMGNRLPKGYGKIRLNNKTILVHRISAHIFLGLDLDSILQVQHKCNNPPCFNPDHFVLGNQQQNLEYRTMCGRESHKNQFTGVTHYIKGHLLNSKRKCMICVLENQRIRRAKLKNV